MIVDDLRQPCTAFCEYESCTCDVFHGSMCVTEPVSDSLCIQLPAVSSGMGWKMRLLSMPHLYMMTPQGC